jgi:hypothetical protein
LRVKFRQKKEEYHAGYQKLVPVEPGRATGYGKELGAKGEGWNIPPAETQDLIARIGAADTILSVARNETTRTKVVTAWGRRVNREIRAYACIDNFFPNGGKHETFF